MNAASIQKNYEVATPFAGPQVAPPLRISATPFRWPDASTLPRRPWVFGRWLLRQTVSAIVSPGGVGKSSFVASMLLSLASGREDVLGKTVWGGPKAVWYWNLEDTLPELEMQFTAASMFHRVTQEACGNRVYIDSGPEGSALCIAVEDREGFKIAVPVVEALIAELKSRRVDVLVIDPFVSSHAVSENDNGAIDAVAKVWARIAKEANCAVVLVHHTKKLAGEKVTAETSRGAVALIAAARITLVLNRMDRDEANRFGIAEDRERLRLFSVRDDKANRAPAEDALWFRMASQDIGNATGPDDPYGEWGDSVGVVTRWTPPDAFDGITTDHLRQVQTLVGAGEYKAHHSATDWVGNAVADVLKVDPTDKAHRARILKLVSTWEANGALKVEERRDQNRQMKKFMVVGRLADDLPATPVAGVAAQVSQVSHSDCYATPTPRRGCGVAGAAGMADAGVAARPSFPHGNPAFEPARPMDTTAYDWGGADD